MKLKKLLSILLTIVMFTAFLPAIALSAEVSDNGQIKLGDYVKIGTYNGQPILWRCVAFEKISDTDANGNPITDSTKTVTEYQDGYLPLMLADTSICNKAFDAEGSVTTGSHGRNSEREQGGSNYWADSNIRDWLNSSDDTVTYTCGNAPSYSDEAGFLTNFSDAEKAMMKTVTQKSLLAERDYNALDADKRSGSEKHIFQMFISSIAQNYSKVYSEQVTDTMFLMDVQQVKNAYDSCGDYYKPSSYYWLRSPDFSFNNFVRVVSSNGNVYYDMPNYYGYGVRPAFYFNPSVELGCGLGTKEKPYIFVDHTIEHHEAVAVTCTTAAVGEYWRCEGENGCGKIFSDANAQTELAEIPVGEKAKGHNYGKWEVNLTETATELIRTCANDPSHQEKRNAEIQLVIPTPYTYNGEECKPKASVKVFNGTEETTLTENTDYTLSYENNVNAGTATVNITGIGDYSGTVQRKFNIAAKTLNVTAATAQNKTYDGTSAVNVTAVTLDGVENGDVVAVNTENLRGTLASTNAGDYTQITLQNLSLINNENHNYILHQPNITVPANVTIAKADVPGVTAGTPLNIANNLEKKYTYILSRLCPQINEEGAAVQKDWGNRSYEIASVSFNKDGYYDDNTAYIGTAESGGTVDNTIYLPIKFKDTEVTGKAAEITIKISSDNYNDFTNTFEVNASNKEAVHFGGITAQDKVYNGSAQTGYTGDLTITDSNGNAVALTPEIRYTGRLNTGYSERAEAPTNAGTYSVIFRVADTDENYIGKRTVNFEITKADGSGSVTMADFRFGEESSVPVPVSETNGTDNVTYMYKPQGAEDSAYKSDKPTTAGEYTVKAVFAETQNYKQAEATADFTINHDYSDAWSHDASNHWHECSCGSKADEGAHTWNEGAVTQTATCTLEGRTRYACTVCGREKVETIAPFGHEWGAWSFTTEPTFTHAGAAKRVCARNNAHEETAALSDLTDTAFWTLGTRVEPTETTKGSQEYVSEYGSVKVILPATGDCIKYENGKAVATVRQDGTYTVIFAAYDGDRLLSVSVQEAIQLAKGENPPISPHNFNANGKVKVMLWDSLNAMKPLCVADGN